MVSGGCHFRPKEDRRLTREVHEAEVFDQMRTLGTFAYSVLSVFGVY